jgi:hypothetical protein
MKTILPHAASYIDQFGTGSIGPLLEQFTASLLSKLVNSLDLPESDARSFRIADTITALIQKPNSEQQLPEVHPSLLVTVPRPPEPS